MTAVVLRLPRANLRRWHGALADGLTRAGFAVHLDLVDTRPNPCPFDALRVLEGGLFHIEPEAAGARIAALPVPGRTPGSDAAQAIVLDCTGDDGASTTRRLVPDFGGLSHEAGLAEALLRRDPPVIAWRRAGTGEVVTAGRAALVSPHVLTQGFDHACARMASLGVKAARLAAAGVAPALALPGGGRPVPPGPVGMLMRHAANEVRRRLTSGLFGRPPRWNVGWRRIPGRGGILDTGVLGDEPFRWLAGDPSRFVADPFAFAHDGRTYVFVEELPFATWRGFISVFEIGADGAPTPLRPVLEQPFHLSYPSVFVEDGAIWMIPETRANRTVELYRADPFPDRWVRERVLIEDIGAADATYFRHDGRCWLAVSTDEHGASSWDSLSLFHAEALAGPWTAHRLNPVRTDPAGARPAGWLHQGRLGLIRPAQDCVGAYGAALALNRVERLDPDTYEETPVARIAPPAAWKARGLHTVTAAGGFEVIDACF